jgi:hypothetical protein
MALKIIRHILNLSLTNFILTIYFYLIFNLILYLYYYFIINLYFKKW